MRGAVVRARMCLQTAASVAAFLVLVSVSWVISSTHAQAQNFRFTQIVVEGNQRVGDAAVITRAGIAPGQTLTAGQVNDARRNLENSGLFETVSVDPQGNRLVITVTEFPTINRLTFEGNRRVDDEALSAVIQSVS